MQSHSVPVHHPRPDVVQWFVNGNKMERKLTARQKSVLAFNVGQMKIVYIWCYYLQVDV